MQFVVEEMRYARHNQSFVGGFQPYMHQLETLRLVREAIARSETICIENTSITGSGKTLANFAAAILDGVRTCGVYPTNELLHDQWVSLYGKLPVSEMVLLDSQGLDDAQSVNPGIRSHAQGISWVTGDVRSTAVLTNPDVLYFVMYSLYGQMFSSFHLSSGVRAFQNMLNEYPVIAFDEFHLYSTKQIASTAFIMATVKELAPEKPHIFIFSSATPQPQFRQYVERLGMVPYCVGDQPVASGHVVCEQIEINLLSADLLRWQGGDCICTELDTILTWADQCQPERAKGVFIVDSVYEAKNIANLLRERYNAQDVGEVHGYMDPGERTGELTKRFSVGTTTIDVGVDLTGNKAKDFLVCEARSAAQAIQRIGRLGRGGRDAASIDPPNRVWLVVPAYVYEYLNNRLDGGNITRETLNRFLNEAYMGHEAFLAYAKKYSPLEAVAAGERIRRQQYFADTGPQAEQHLYRLVATLYDKQPPTTQEQAEQSYQKYCKRQRAVWHKFGTEIKQTLSKSTKYFLSDLESFRGGMESDFTVAIYDELDLQLHWKPVKYYNLPFVLRRAEGDELSRHDFEELVRKRHPAQADEWLAPLDGPQCLLGYIHVTGLSQGKASAMYFEMSRSAIGDTFQQVIRLEGFSIGGGQINLLHGKGSLNGQLKQRKLNCWVSERKSFNVSLSLQLPPLFTIYPLRATLPNGKPDEWSIAFGLDAFLLDSITRRYRWAGARSQGGAMIH